MPPRPKGATAEEERSHAETLGLEALAFLAADDEVFPRFVALTGLGLDALRAGAGDPAFLGGVLDFILADEPLLLAFAAAQGLKPEAIIRLRRRLPGAAEWG